MNPQMPQKSHTLGGKKGKKKSGRISTLDPQMPQKSHTSGGKKGKKNSGRISTSDPQMPQKSHTLGGKKGKKKSGRMSTSDQDTTQLEEEQEQQQPLSATFLDNARFEDLAANIDNLETNREVLQPRTESLVPAPQQAEDEENSSQSVTEAGDVKTAKTIVQPGPTGPPWPSGQTRSVSGAAAAVGERAGAGAEKAGKSSGQVQGERECPQGRGFRPDLDESNSDLDIHVPMYSINDPEFCTEVMVQTVSLLSPNAIQQVSQTLARTSSTVKHPFPVLAGYFVAKERDFRAICADFLRHRELLKQGEAPIFFHDDHRKLLYIVTMKFRAVKATYQSYRASDMQNDSMNIQLIKQRMTECMRVYYNALPRLDMLAPYHNIPFSDTASNHGGDLGSLRSEGARQRRSTIVDQDLREQLSDTANYVNTQAAVQSQGLQRRYDFQ
jgi:hypothetical protein